ncbi:terpene synthase family protein [Streptomyces jumonjinensis]|uniref:terpene synthase family protein n=1 Tax=Streptomyces jumonjinensis TaxID=1945 RepID=UPI0037A8FDB0
MLKPCPGLTPGTRVRLPEIGHYLFCELHPDHAAIIRENDDWTAGALLAGRPADEIARTREILGSQLTCMAYPHGDRDRVHDICNITDFGFVVDDDLARMLGPHGWTGTAARLTVDRYAEAIWESALGKTPPDAPFPPEAIRELFGRIRSRVGEGFFERLLKGMASWLAEGQTEELAPVVADHPDPLVPYLRLRRKSAGCVAYEGYSQYVLGMENLADALATEEVRAYHRATTASWVLPNDLFSFRAECFGGDHNNAVCLLRRVRGLSLQEAVDDVAARIGAAQLDVLEQYDRITASSRAGAELETYLLTLQNVAAANLRWSYMTPRYHGENFRWNGVLSGELTLDPGHTRFPAVVPVPRPAVHRPLEAGSLSPGA